MFNKLLGRVLLAIALLFITGQALAAAPSVPSSISVPATATENVNYTVSWGASSGTVTSYELMGELTYLGSGNSSFRSKVRNKPAGNYCYKVRACNGTSCSAYTGKKCVDVLARTQTPVISPATGSYTGNVNVTIAAASGATIRYTVNNTEVTGSSPVYTGPFTVSSTTTVRARAFKSGMANSTETRSVLTIYPAPVVTQFEWLPRTVIVGKPTSFYWNVKNVSSCTALSSGTGSPTTRPASGVSGPHIYSSPREHTTKWYCTDLAGKRFPQNSNEYLTAPSSVVAKPVVNRFEWSPQTQIVGQPTSFYWDVSNVSSCTALSAGYNAPTARAASGVSGPHTYTSAIQHMTTWYCTDLAGGRYPEKADQYLTAPLSVVPAPVLKQFEWIPDSQYVGKPTSFYWDVSNVTSCTSESSGTGSPVTHPKNGVSGPHIYSSAFEHMTSWYCTDLAGGRFPRDATKYLTAPLSMALEPVVNRFEWQPAEVEVGQPTNFYWNVANANECSEVTANGSVIKRASSGQLGPFSFDEPGQITFKWFCKDLAGNRYPIASGSFIEAGVNVVAPLLTVPEVELVVVGTDIDVSWQPVFGATSYKLQQQINDSWQSEVNVGSALSKSFIGSPGKKYTYRVKACNTSGCSLFGSSKTLYVKVVTYLHTDVLGSVIAESDSNGTIIKKTDYKPFGESKDN